MEKIENTITKPSTDPTPPATVDYHIAEQYTNNWQTFFARNVYAQRQFAATNPNWEAIEQTAEFQFLKDNSLRGFKIPLEDLTAIMQNITEYNSDDKNQTKVNSIRAYVARDTVGPEADADNHVYILPVATPYGEPNGADLLEYIYDFSTPCPKQCDTNSPLYNIRNDPDYKG